jgi:hypothetical protein
MFRAGRLPGPDAPLTLVHPQFSGSYVILADCSEFQADIADALYLSWSEAIIIRALYGDAHDDAAWYNGARRAALHAGGARFLGIYAYLVAGQNGAAQAQAFRKLVGAIQPGEVFIADFEEGSKTALADWYNEMLYLYGQAIAPYLWTYSGLSFGAAEAVLPVQWLAAYGVPEPSSPHKLWQFTDAYAVPGVGTCDASVFHGTIDQLAALAYQAKPNPAPPPAPGPAPAPAPPLEEDMPAGVIEVAEGVRESRTWAAGTVKQIVLYSDWQGLQSSAPVVDVRIAHMGGPAFDAGTVEFGANGTGVYTIVNNSDCNGCSFTRKDAGPATVAFHTNA